MREALGAAFVAYPPLLKIIELNARVHLLRSVRDAGLRRRLTPDYALGCKRVLFSSDWYPAIQEPNVEVVTEGLAEVRERSIVLDGGGEREVDTIVFATGFSPTDPPIARRLRGRGGVSLADAWSDGMRAYLGTSVAGFPNLFLLYGPNTNLAHTSIVFMMEQQIGYALAAVQAMRRRRLAAVEVRREVEESWTGEMQQRLAGTVWNTGGCSSWYLDSRGNNPIMWPGFTFTYRRRMRRFEIGDYAVERPVVSPGWHPQQVPHY